MASVNSWPLCAHTRTGTKHLYVSSNVYIYMYLYIHAEKEKYKISLYKTSVLFSKTFQIFTCIVNNIHFEILLIFYDF